MKYSSYCILQVQLQVVISLSYERFPLLYISIFLIY